MQFIESFWHFSTVHLGAFYFIDLLKNCYLFSIEEIKLLLLIMIHLSFYRNR